MIQSYSRVEQTPILSVIIPVYNTESYLHRALDSVLCQDFSSFEVIAINDGSEDQSGRILDSYKKKDSRIKVFHRKNSGLSATRNFGLEQANGAYIYFFDSDDRLLPGAFNRLIPLLKNSGGEVIAFSGRYIDETDAQTDSEESLKKPEVLKPVRGELLLADMIVSGTYSPIVSMYIYRKSFLQNNGLTFFEDYIHEDEFFTISVLCKAERALSSSEVLFEHRIREDSIMTNPVGLKNLEGWAKAVSQMLTFVRRNPIENATQKAVNKRIRKLTSNCVRIIHQLRKQEKHDLSIDDYWNKEELKQLGFEVRFRYRFPNLFKVYNKLKVH